MTPTAGARRTPRLLALSGAAALGLTAGVAAPAWAHDTLISSTPEADEVLTESPEEIVLEFSGSGLTQGEDIPNEILVRDEDGQSWESEDPAEVEGNTMTTDLQEPLPNGEYTVLYHVVYSDGHDEELSFEFEVDDPAAAVSEQADADEAEDLTEESSATEDAVPTWAPILFAGAGVLVVITVLVLVRQKMKQAENWQDRSDESGEGDRDHQ